MPEGPSWCVLVERSVVYVGLWKSPGGVYSIAGICSTCCRNRGSLLFLCWGSAVLGENKGSGSRSRAAFCCKPVLLKSRSPCLIKPFTPRSRLWRTKCLPRALIQEALEGPYCVVMLYVEHKLFVVVTLHTKN